MGQIDWAAIDKLRRDHGAPALKINESYDDEIKFVRFDQFPKSLRSVELIHLTDLQIGAKSFKRKRFLEYRDWILSVPNRYVLLGGDLIDAATVLSIASPYDNTEEPIEQVDTAIDLLKPLAHRLLASVGGNHERRCLRTFGDVGRSIARALDVPYSRGIIHLDLIYGSHRPFTVSMWHGGGAARTRGAQVNMLHAFMQKVDSQVCFVGHLHTPNIVPEWRHVRIGRRIKLQKRFGIMSSSFQAFWNTYAEVACMNPSDTMMGRVILEPDGHWEVTLR